MSLSTNAAPLDPRVRRTRRAIQDAFLGLLSERGLAALTVSDITARAEINRATFYAHHQDKYELFTQLIGERFTAILAQHAPVVPQLTEVALRGVLLAVGTFMSQVYEGCHVHDSEMEFQIERQVQSQLIVWVQTALDAAVQRPNSRQINATTLATLIATSLYTVASQWGREQTQRSFERHITEAMVFVWGGVVATGFEPHGFKDETGGESKIWPLPR